MHNLLDASCVTLEVDFLTVNSNVPTLQGNESTLYGFSYVFRGIVDLVDI